MRGFGGMAGAAALVLALAGAAGAGPRVVSLDQCADQFVLELVPRGDIAGLSYRAPAPDSYLREVAKGLPLRRADLESVLAARPVVVVREWGGDEGMIRRLQARGVRVVGIDDANDFDGVRANIRKVAAALGRAPEGEALIGRMDLELAAARGAWRGRGVGQAGRLHHRPNQGALPRGEAARRQVDRAPAAPGAPGGGQL